MRFWIGIYFCCIKSTASQRWISGTIVQTRWNFSFAFHWYTDYSAPCSLTWSDKINHILCNQTIELLEFLTEILVDWYHAFLTQRRTIMRNVEMFGCILCVSLILYSTLEHCSYCWSIDSQCCRQILPRIYLFKNLQKVLNDFILNLQFFALLATYGRG